MLKRIRGAVFTPRRLWQMVREVDLEAIRRESERPFRLLLVAEASPVAQAVAAMLTGAGGARHPWLITAGPLEARAAEPPDAALLLSPLPDLEPAMAAAAQELGSAGVPVVTVVMGGPSPLAEVVRSGEAARAVITGLEPEDAKSIAESLLSVVPPDRRLALARHLPPLRRAAFARLIDEAAKANAVYALTAGLAEVVPVLDLPLNLADVFVLTKNQLMMSYRIALAAGKEGSPRHLLGEILGVVGSGFLLRQGARSLIGLFPVIGLVPKVAVAYAGTWAMGWAVATWAVEGHKLSRSSVRHTYREALRGGRRVAAGLVGQVRRAPARLLGRGTAQG